MRSIRNLLLTLTGAILALAVLAPQSSRAEESRTLTLTKQCNTDDQATVEGELPFCTVLASNFRRLIGARIRYFGPGFFTADHPFLDSWVVIESTQGGTAFGHCLLRGVPEPLGACQFTGGSGSLQGFEADVTVTTEDGKIWHWNGTRSTQD
jgi:hypothetical protein